MIGIYPQTDGSVFVDGAVAVRNLNNGMAWTLPVENAKTIAGLILCETAAIPEQGQAFIFPGYRFEVACKSGNRIAALKVTPLDTKSASRISMQQAEVLIPILKSFFDQRQLNGEPTVARVEELRCDGHAVRVALLEGLWWVFCADAASQIDHSLEAEDIFSQAPESERRITRTEIETCVYLVSSGYLLFRLGRSETINHYRFRAWLRAWKTITEAIAISGC